MTPRVRRHLPTLVLAAAVYVPLLLTARGRVGADTKAYLYLDPDRLLSRAWSMWDPSSGLGGLSHQTIGYLWPMGPWFWAAEHAGLPDWVAQRLWLGTILFAAGLGTRWLLERVLGWRTAPAMTAAFVYACTPYVLSLAARISVILLPFAGLPWLLGLTMLAVRRGGWRYPALFALVVATVGSVNATALALVGLGPVWWLVHARLSGAVTTRSILTAVARIGGLTVAVNLWWIGGLWAQSGWGIDILRYTETAEAITTASNAVELLRGLGYWFFYGSDRLGPWIEPAVDYTQRLPLLVLTFALPIGALLSFGLVRFKERTFAVGLVALGLVAAVGAHPYDDPPLTGRLVRAFLDTDTGLAMRSLPRAVPLLALGMAMGLGMGAAALGSWLAERRPSWRAARPAPVCAAVAVLAYAALPPLWTGGMVAHNLDRPEAVPSYWTEAAGYLDSRDDSTRVLEIPGAEFASYRWGNTVDPISPGVMERPMAAHELIPYGSPPSADLLAAFDDRLQERTLSPRAVAVLARLLGAGDVLLRDDLQYERYRTPRPYTIVPFLASASGLEPPVPFGEPVVNQPVATALLDDELALSTRGGARDVARPPLEVYGVTDPVPIVRTHGGDGGVVLAGDGSGLVDVADAGLLSGAELVRYGASLPAASLAEALAAPGTRYVITDGNRRQGRRWSTVRDLYGLVEPPPSLRDDPTDNRLPLFPDAGDEWRTTAASGGASVAATSYGNPISFTPEYRPGNAVDGDTATEWRTGADADVVGERLELTIPGGSSATAIRFVQQLTGARNRHLTAVDVRLDDGPAQRVALDGSSLTLPGQEVALEHGGARFDKVTIELVADSSGRRSRWGRPQRFVGLTQVGFAEVSLLGDGEAPTVDQALVLPVAATTAITDGVPLDLVLTRWRTDPTDAVRQDPEPSLARRWAQPVARTFTVGGTARLTPDALDPRIDATLGVGGGLTVSSSTRLIGVPAARASAALDGDPATWWSPSFFDEAPWVEVVAPAPATVDRLAPVLVDDGVRSVATQLSVSADGGAPVVVDLPPGGGEVALPAPVTGSTFRFTVSGMDRRTSIDWFSQQPILEPPAIAELGLPPGLVAARPPTFDTGCRSDLLTVDGAGVPVRVSGSTADALAGIGFPLQPCGDGPLVLGPGPHELRAVNGLASGIDLDQLVLTSGSAAAPSAAAPSPSVDVLHDDGWKLRVRVTGATPGTPFWLVLGQSFNTGWEVDGEQPELVDGFANGWRLTPDAGTFELTLTWKPQQVVNVGLIGSVVGALVSLVLALRRRFGEGDVENVVDDRPVGGLLTVAAVTVASALAIGGPAAVVVGAVGVAAWRWRVARWALRLLPAATYGLAAAYVVLRQAVAKPSPAFEWPAELATSHQPALVAIAFLVLAVSLRDEPGGARSPAG